MDLRKRRDNAGRPWVGQRLKRGAQASPKMGQNNSCVGDFSAVRDNGFPVGLQVFSKFKSFAYFTQFCAAYPTLLTELSEEF